MRHLADFETSALAERFQDFLIAGGIHCSLEESEQGPALWVTDEDRLAEAKAQLAEFLAHPDDPKYLEARSEANAVLKAAAAKRKAARANVVSLSDRWRAPTLMNCPLTVGVIVLCIFVYVEMHLIRTNRHLAGWLFISTDGTWSEIARGELWRLVTPMLMHGGAMHILFNLLIWWDFGSIIEARKGSFKFLLIVLACSITGNVLQFLRVGPNFLGLSGVDFGLFGYLWMKGHLDPDDGLGVSRSQIQWTLLWFALCWFGAIGRIANWVHTGGLVMGVLLGACSAGWRHLRRRMRPTL